MISGHSSQSALFTTALIRKKTWECILQNTLVVVWINSNWPMNDSETEVTVWTHCNMHRKNSEFMEQKKKIIKHKTFKAMKNLNMFKNSCFSLSCISIWNCQISHVICVCSCGLFTMFTFSYLRYLVLFQSMLLPKLVLLSLLFLWKTGHVGAMKSGL